MKQKLLLAAGFLLFGAANAQVEGAYMHTKNFKGFGFGGHLNFKFPVTDAASLTAEAGIYILKQPEQPVQDEANVALVPILLGYQYTVDGSGTGFFVEPLAGYTYGATDIYKYDENGDRQWDMARGRYVNQSAKGLTAGLAAGYITRGHMPITFGLRYERVFVAADPGINIVASRVQWPLFGGRRDD